MDWMNMNRSEIFVFKNKNNKIINTNIKNAYDKKLKMWWTNILKDICIFFSILQNSDDFFFFYYLFE